MEWLFEDKVTESIGGSIMEGRGKVLHKVVYALNQHLIFGTLSPIVRIHGPRNQGMEKCPLTITPSDPLRKVLLPVPTILGSAGLEVWL